MQRYVTATFPSVMTALRLLLTLPCGVASGNVEKKNVKSQLRVNLRALFRIVNPLLGIYIYKR